MPLFGQVSSKDLIARAKAEKRKNVIIAYDDSINRTQIITIPQDLLKNAFGMAPLKGPGPMAGRFPFLFMDIGYEGTGDGLKSTPETLRIAFSTNT